MAECRYNGNCCVMYHRPFDSDELPCDGYDEDICSLYEPMPDVDALLELADGLEKDADNIISAARNAQFTGSGPRMEEAKHDAYDWRQIAARIRKALGVER